MDRYCKRCGRSNQPLHRHHLINGNGKRKSCETEHSVIDLCWECHHWIHNTDPGRAYWRKLRVELQRKYFAMGYDEGQVRDLLGGKLYLSGEAIEGL